ncbi:MAG: hypothetical protein IKH14_06735 [Prevotella sp.]|nr:hypothetical protein [Prevotella sp.]
MVSERAYIYCASHSISSNAHEQIHAPIVMGDRSWVAAEAFLMMAIGGFCFMLQGLLHKPDIIWSLFLTNLVTMTCSIIVFGIKVYNDYFKKRQPN